MKLKNLILPAITVLSGTGALAQYQENTSKDIAQTIQYHTNTRNYTIAHTIPSGKHITYDPTSETYHGNIVDEEGKRMLAMPVNIEEKDAIIAQIKKYIEEQLIEIPLTLTGGSFVSPELGTWHVAKKMVQRENNTYEEVYILTINGETYEIEIKWLSLEGFSKQRNKHRAKHEFKVETSIFGATISMQQMVDALYAVFEHTQHIKTRRSCNETISIYKLWGKTIAAFRYRS